ncbi:MAG: YheT family hydrolase [Blastocatellia bacterium]|jgi:predicted alpha/beta-fold hydrolase
MSSAGEIAASFRPFRAAWGLANGHAMTIIGSLRRRDLSRLTEMTRMERREFVTEAETRVVAWSHYHNGGRRPLVLIVHGLEGSAESGYVRGTAIKALAAGFNVLRYNVRNCGGTSALSPHLYHSGLTSDLSLVIRELIEDDGVEDLFIVGYSMGGNQSLKLAGELGAQAPQALRGVCAISPPIDLASCSEAIREPRNWVYEQRFVRSLARTMREKDRLFPGRYDLRGLDQIRHLWDWDDHFQPYNGFRDARDYYQRASAISFLPAIRVPTLIIHAKDDPFIPFGPFCDDRLRGNPSIGVLATDHGGHVAFCGVRQADEDRAWAENRVVEFFRRLLEDCAVAQ